MSLYDSILSAELAVRKHLRFTPAEHSLFLSKKTGAEVYLKLENYQVTGSFKARGAINKLSQLSDDEKACGVITASSGNHGLGVASGAKKLGIHAIVYVPEYADRSKVQAIELEGAEVKPFGDDVIAGQGTIGVELVQQIKQLDAVFVSVGGGGLISGIGAYLKEASPQTKVIACSPSQSPAMHECMKAKKIIDVACYPTLSDATAGGVEEGAVTLNLCRSHIDESILVDEAEIKEAMLFTINQHHMLIEGAAGVAIAAFLKEQESYKGKRVAILICGGNIGIEKLRQVIS